MNNNYNFPRVALKALTEHQPRDYQFNLENRALFDVSKVPKSVKILNGDVGEEAANYQAKTLVSQLQSEKAHAQYHMIPQLHTNVDVSDAELLYTQICFARYAHKEEEDSLGHRWQLRRRYQQHRPLKVARKFCSIYSCKLNLGKAEKSRGRLRACLFLNMFAGWLEILVLLGPRMAMRLGMREASFRSPD